jgi:hypothetical protein
MPLNDTTAAEDIQVADKPRPNVEELTEALRSPLTRSTALTGLLILMIFYTLYFARGLILPIVLAMLLNFLLAPVVRALKKYLGMPEPLGAIVVVLAVLVGIGYGIYTPTGPTADWVARAPQSMHQIQSKLRALRKPVQQVQEAAEQVQSIATPGAGGGTHSSASRPGPNEYPGDPDPKLSDQPGRGDRPGLFPAGIR